MDNTNQSKNTQQKENAQSISIAHLNSTQVDLFSSQKSNDSFISNADNNFVNQRVKICNTITKILLIVTALLVVFNLSIFTATRWSTHIIAMVTIILLCAVVPIKYQCSPITQIKLFLTTIAVTTIATELAVSTPNQLIGYSIFAVLPIVNTLTLLFIDCVLLFARNKTSGWFITLMYCTAIALLPQILLWTSANIFQLPQAINTITVIVVYNLPIANLIIMFCAKAKYAISDLARTFYF